MPSLEDVISKLTTAVEANTAAILGNATAPEAPAAEPAKKGRRAAAPADAAPSNPPAEAPAGPTLQDLRAAAQAVLDSNGNDPAPIAELNKEYGVKRISEIAAEKYGEAIQRLKKLVKSGAI